jgi:hypothetical protein
VAFLLLAPDSVTTGELMAALFLLGMGVFVVRAAAEAVRQCVALVREGREQAAADRREAWRASHAGGGWR